MKLRDVGFLHIFNQENHKTNSELLSLNVQVLNLFLFFNVLSQLFKVDKVLIWSSFANNVDTQACVLNNLKSSFPLWLPQNNILH